MSKIWGSDHEIENVVREKSLGFIKRKHGSGGHTIFSLNQLEMNKEFKTLMGEGDWFFEEEVIGTPFSIQCAHLSQDDTITIFGYTKQHIANGKYFIGSSFLPLADLAGTILSQLQIGIERLQPLLKDYEGFFGLDFIVEESKKVHILEANIRLTAATIPALLLNTSGHAKAEFREDVPNKEAVKATMTLAQDNSEKTSDTLIFLPSHHQLGTSFFLDLQECDKVPKQVTEDYVSELAKRVAAPLGKVIGQTFFNFWPHGWTVCFILEASHCVISTWYLEKRVLIDAFSCVSDIEGRQVHEMFTELFDSNKPGRICKQVR